MNILFSARSWINKSPFTKHTMRSKSR